MLVAGKNDLIIDDMYAHMRDIADILCCSARFDDRIRHVELFEPDIFCICLSGETEEEITNFSDMKRKLTSKGIYTVVVGKEDECEMFQKQAVQMADLVLTRPITVDIIRRELRKSYDMLLKQREEEALMLKELEEIRKQRETKRILVVDDDPLMLKLIKEYLGEQYIVATAVSGKIAHKYLETREVDLILLDYEMPEENGVEVLKKLRENEKLSNIPVFFLTGVSDKERLYEALALKPQGYLIKPVDKEKLLGTLEKYLGQG